MPDNPVPTIWTVMNPEEPVKYFIILVPDIWGPFDSVDELKAEYAALRVAGQI